MTYGPIKNVNLYLDGQQIEQVNTYKSLGTILNSVKTTRGNIFKHNPEYLNNRAKKAIFGIQKKLKHVPNMLPTHMFYLYDTYIWK